jgi:hypothetical protein
MSCATPLITNWRTIREGSRVIYSFQLVSDAATRIPDGMTDIICTFEARPTIPIEPIVNDFLRLAYRRTILQCIVVNKIKCTKNGESPSKGELSPPENQILSLWVNPPSNGEEPSTRKNDHYLIHRDNTKKPAFGVEIPRMYCKSI